MVDRNTILGAVRCRLDGTGLVLEGAREIAVVAGSCLRVAGLVVCDGRVFVCGS